MTENFSSENKKLYTSSDNGLERYDQVRHIRFWRPIVMRADLAFIYFLLRTSNGFRKARK